MAKLIRKIASELQEQIALTKWCVLNGITLVKIPNDGKRTPIEGHLAKLSGLRSGFPDVMILLPMGRCLFIELKRARAYTRSEMASALWLKQQDWLDWLTGHGYTAARCYGWQEAVRFIEQQLKD